MFQILKLTANTSSFCLCDTSNGLQSRFFKASSHISKKTNKINRPNLAFIHEKVQSQIHRRVILGEKHKFKEHMKKNLLKLKVL